MTYFIDEKGIVNKYDISLTLWFFFFYLSYFCQSNKGRKNGSAGDSYCGVAEEAEYDHGEGRGEDGAEHDAGQQAVDQSDDHILCSDQHRACPAVQRAP